MALARVTSGERRGAAHLMRWLADIRDAWRAWFEGKTGAACTLRRIADHEADLELRRVEFLKKVAPTMRPEAER